MKFGEPLSEITERTVQLIGAGSIDRSFESWYAYVSRLVRCNLLTASDAARSVPADWIKWAFMPRLMSIEGPSGVDAEVLDRYKLRPGAWQLFSSWSTSLEILRGCPRCLEQGYHSYAMQDELLVLCPLHGCALRCDCPHCGVPLVRSVVLPLSNAFRCPRGCSLTAATQSGLYVPDLDVMTARLAEHLDWICATREKISLCGVPLYVAYPPHWGGAEGGGDAQRTPGLIGALLAKLNDAGAHLPAALEFHPPDAGRWSVRLTRWSAAVEYRGADRPVNLALYHDAFRRGVFSSRVPVIDIDAWARWHAAHRRCEAVQSMALIDAGTGVKVVELSSFLLTNAEVAALWALLAQWEDEVTAGPLYNEVLFEVLERACARRAALDCCNLLADCLRLEEVFEAVVRVGRDTWRISGRTQSSGERSAAWIDYREVADFVVGPLVASGMSGLHRP